MFVPPVTSIWVWGTSLVIWTRNAKPLNTWMLRLLLVGVGWFAAWLAVAEDHGPIIPQGKGVQCVADTDFMRRNHMRLLDHQRDETVIRGIRDEPFSLTECVDCHAQKDADGQPVRVDGEGQFCQSCHAYAAVKIDCFGCHAAVPEQASAVQPLDSSSVSVPACSTSAALTSLATYRYELIQKSAIKD